MANRRRLLLTCTPELWATIDRFHRVSGRPRSAIASEFLGVVASQMDEISDILEEVNGLQGEALENVRQAADGAAEELASALDGVRSALSNLSAAARQEPPTSNTGVTDPQPVPKFTPPKAA